TTTASASRRSSTCSARKRVPASRSRAPSSAPSSAPHNGASPSRRRFRIWNGSSLRAGWCVPGRADRLPILVRDRLGRSPQYVRPGERGVTLLFELIAVAALILLNGFFVAAEYGLVTVRRTRMVELDHEGDRRARQVLRATDSPPRFIAAMQLGVT